MGRPSKLSPHQQREAIARRDAGEALTNIARTFGVLHTAIGTLEALRRTILDIIPEAEQCISHGMPAFNVQGKIIAGFAAFQNHLSYLPHSDSVLPKLGDALSQYKTSKGALQFSTDRPLPKALVKKLIAIRKRHALGR
jgi:uncharacterized protein YdhG (YjbR/CyaY superfamily)